MGIPILVRRHLYIETAPSRYLNQWSRLLYVARPQWVNTLRPRQNGRHFADDIFKCIFLNENVFITVKISLKFVPKGPIKNIPALVQIMAWRRPGGKPLSEPMLVSLTTHICVTRPQWVNHWFRWRFVFCTAPSHYQNQCWVKRCFLALQVLGCWQEWRLYSIKLWIRASLEARGILYISTITCDTTLL